jgi:hypothetical protein
VRSHESQSSILHSSYVGRGIMAIVPFLLRECACLCCAAAFNVTCLVACLARQNIVRIPAVDYMKSMIGPEYDELSCNVTLSL